jgi:hypothetical protein
MSDRRNNPPDSDETVRKQIDREETGIQPDDLDTDLEGRQISNKSGKHSSAQKLAASRPEFGPSPGANPVAGASGKRDELGRLDNAADDVEFAAENDQELAHAGKNAYPTDQRGRK